MDLLIYRTISVVVGFLLALFWYVCSNSRRSSTQVPVWTRKGVVTHTIAISMVSDYRFPEPDT